MKITSNCFNAYSRYYNLLYQDKDYPSETNYIKSLLIRQGLKNGSLLEFGSGTGKHASLLAENGYKIHGIERSAEMVSQIEPVNGFTCEQGDICTIQLGRAFDAVLSFFHVVSYQTDNESLHAVFGRAAEHLKSGGIFIFDFWYSPAVYAQRPAVRVKRMADKDMKITRIAEPVIYPNENRVDVNYTIFAYNTTTSVIETTSETHSMRHFSLPEIEFLANTHGFNCIVAEEFLTGKPLDDDTWGACVTLVRV